MTSNEIIATCYMYIESKDLEGFQEYAESLILDTEKAKTFSWDYIFHRVYLHACLKGAEPIASWLQTTLYPMLSPIEQIALRQIFPYGRHLMATAKRLEEARRTESV
jgi:hypothetical protein